MRAIRSLGMTFLLLPAMLAAIPAAAATQPAEPSTLVAIRTGSHAGFDRVVLEFRGPIGTPEARWVAAVRAGGSGGPVPLRGDASLRLVVPGVAHDRRGAPTVRDRRRTPDFPTLREVRLVADGGGRLTLGIGTASRTTFKLAALSGPSRLVVDVAHPAGAGPPPLFEATAPARPDAGTTPASIGGGNAGGGAAAGGGAGGGGAPLPPNGAWPWALLGLGGAAGTVGAAAAARGRRQAAAARPAR